MITKPLLLKRKYEQLLHVESFHVPLNTEVLIVACVPRHTQFLVSHDNDSNDHQWSKVVGQKKNRDETFGNNNQKFYILVSFLLSDYKQCASNDHWYSRVPLIWNNWYQSLSGLAVFRVTEIALKICIKCKSNVYTRQLFVQCRPCLLYTSRCV